ncbi:peptidase U32 family protein [Vibrio sp. TH_r3]|uniref:peptidase U32 family protein n=1 Tax=Vibrio sp. TH_r3 TaxID=3082084 RepID=UPI00295479E7|nr:peptidase U32 family protein [Vibrio sp. TH_r3]MDV7103347.1 peptidase U32 family protein [Vibrio sp. TH_r3]
MDKSQFELLAPGGDLESIKAAIVAGADAIYCGLDRFNARNRAENLSLDNLNQVIEVAHKHDCKIFLTLNIIILENEIPAITRLLKELVDTKVDGVIVQDIGLAYILKHYFPQLDVHASTQLNTHNEGQILFMHQLGVSRVNLSRELNIKEIKRLTQFGLKHNVLMEVFVHGSYCIGFSGLCYMSSARNGASGNRGRCSQPCRDQYQTTEVGSDYPLNMKDNSAFGDLQQLADAGVYSLKVEGRIKKAHYVYTVVDNWRKQIDAYCDGKDLLTDTSELYTVFNRDFSDGYLQSDISRNMYINHPRDNASRHFVKIYGVTAEQDIKKVQQDLFDKKTAIMQKVEEKTKNLLPNSEPVKALSLKAGGVNTIPKLTPHTASEDNQRLSVLIASEADIAQVQANNVDVYFELPNALSSSLTTLIELFQQNSNLIPWFPSVLIDKDYDAAQEFLHKVAPALVVTNNMGVGHIAAEKGIAWIAGPQTNITNSYALKCLKEEFNCSGAFISNEITRIQMRRLVRPDNFQILHSIYHPNGLLTSRQCLFQQTSGCKKMKINRGCLPRCEKYTSIINLNQSAYVIDKQKGNFNTIYGNQHVFNPNVVNELPELFTGFMIDLRDIKTHTSVKVDKPELVTMFNQFIHRQENSVQPLQQNIVGTVNNQYVKGL